MPLKTYPGSCLCGDVKFEADLDMTKEPIGKCNCTNCWKLRFWYVRVQPQHFRLLTPMENITEFVLRNQDHHQMFCTRCGVHCFHKLTMEALGGEFWSVQISCLDGVDPDEVREFKTRYSDGKNNNWRNEPKEKDLL